MKTILTLLLVLITFMPSATMAQEDFVNSLPVDAEPVAVEIQQDYFKGQVLEILEDDVLEIGTFRQPYQKLKTEIISGEDKGEIFEYDYQLAANNLEAQKLDVGDKVVVVKITGDQTEYYVAEPYRTPGIIFVFLVFMAFAIAFAGKKGFTSLIGLAFSMLVIIKFILPQIVAGRSPLMMSLIGSFVILFVALYLAHGFNKRTNVALVGTGITLILSALFAVFAVSVSKLFGLGSEEAISLLQGEFQHINLQGLFLGGVIISALGVLDDVTTAQSATVAEIHRANPNLNAKELYKRGHAVGKEHIASLINTLALAYAGASLPLMLIFTKVDFPLWVNLNSEFLMEEFIRTIVGSTALILAVPITTIIAAKVFENHKVDEGDTEPYCTHVH
jgi:uncharacterized membrane protein